MLDKMLRKETWIAIAARAETIARVCTIAGRVCSGIAEGIRTAVEPVALVRKEVVK